MTPTDLLMAGPWAILPEASQALVQACKSFNASTLKELSFTTSRVANSSTIERANNGQIAVLPIHGVILPYASAFARFLGATCLDALTADFCEMRDNPDIAAIVLDIDSPGGMVTGVHAFSELVFASRSSKPIIAKVAGMAASAAYWIAASASQIVIDPTSLLGSIGVVTTYTDSSEQEKKAGISRIEIVSRQSPHKRLDVSTEEGRLQLQKQVDQLAAVFVEAVALYRNVPTSTVLSNFGQGGLLVGATAVKQGLGDDFCGPRLQTNFLPLTTGDSMMTAIANPTPPPFLTAETVLPSETSKKTENVAANTEASYAQGFQAGLAEGKAQERTRIQGIEAQGLPGHEALIQTLKYDGVSAGSDAAVQILAAEKRERLQVATRLKEEAPTPLPPLAEIPSVASKNLDAQCAAEWEGSTQLRAEFHSIAAYTAYRKAERNGRIQAIRKAEGDVSC